MSGYLIGALGGLVGSILTVVITKILEIFQKSKEHQYSLEKLFFEKKLAAAEAAITQYSILSTALNNLSILYQRLSNDSTEMENHITSNLLEQINDQLKTANDASYIVANSITLYFDFNNQFNHSQVIGDFYNLLSGLQPLMDDTNHYYNNYEKAINSDLEDLAYEKYEEAENKVEEQLENISNSYLQFSQALLINIQEIRNEMSRFDY